jgi:type III secretory pathway lipoprotein EscJ
LGARQSLAKLRKVSTARALLFVSMIACSCEARPHPRPGPAPLDKQAMFGSASLVPTREGERARRELAIAGELEQALAELELGPAHVDVELREPVAVIVIAREHDDRSADEAQVAIAALARAMVPELEPGNLHVWLQPASTQTTAPERAPSWRSAALMLACLGLGLSLGITGERLRSRVIDSPQ